MTQNTTLQAQVGGDTGIALYCQLIPIYPWQFFTKFNSTI